MNLADAGCVLKLLIIIVRAVDSIPVRNPKMARTIALFWCTIAAGSCGDSNELAVVVNSV